jgi:pimeloyl-ACP methyl ester carboxylesterase
MATFVLVHGSFSASWCWREVVPRLEQLGHRAVVLDLPAHGANHMAVEQVTLRDYVDAVSRVVRIQDSSPVLVGHSMGGPIIAGVAEAEPDRTAALVVVAGLLPPNGAAMVQALEGFDPEYLAQAIWAPDRRSVRISPEGTRRFLCSLCSREVVDEVVRRMTQEPFAPYEAPIVTTDASFGRVPRYYVETIRDKVVPLSLQRSIQARVGFSRVFSLDTDHAPFFSAPEALTSCLDLVAADIADM